MREPSQITAELLASGLTAAQTTLLMELVVTMSTGHSGANQVESPGYRTLEKRRAWDRDRKRRKRGVSAMSTGHPPESTGLPAETAEIACNLLKEERGLQKEVIGKKENKKGSRLSENAEISEEDYQFALAANIPPDAIRREWSEFVDYWIAIPGSRGVKMNWHSTWRNRVRAISSKYGKHNGHGANFKRSNTGLERANAKDADILAGMGRGALAVLAKGSSAGSGRDSSGSFGTPSSADTDWRAKNAG